MSLNILAVDGRSPEIAGDAWVAPTATVVGSATIGTGTVLNGAVIRAGSLVAANALVLEGTKVPPGSLAGVPAKVRRALTPQETAHCRQNAVTYAAPTLRHRDAAAAALPA